MIDFIENRIDPNTGTLKVRAVFANKNEALSPGLHARIELPLGKPHKALAINERADRHQPGPKVRVCRQRQNQVVERPVTLGLLNEHMRVVTRRADAERSRDRQRLAAGAAGRHGRSPRWSNAASGNRRPLPASKLGRSTGASRIDTAARSSTVSRTATGTLTFMARFFIDRPVFAWVISIVIVLAGLAAVQFSADRAVSGDHAAHGASHLPVPGRQRQRAWPTPWPRRSSSKSTAWKA